ncbi:hypothetical protein KAFR_0C06040 [Kazachstania africana CBS 2517]|uniref:CUE domain-containing protein n=1 Tax=Kazachstania africana (strain ATCC 22294 / BCRC 22015 / CBS 2517 / CECT 1963 / NBRC 1671 / NRRL Y-8276) TaxID=1071382 RepID=H2AT95_KAZAF|nr:hypothetical protein KAFR_0C06040 [Kazachstania africana CBS 2517]CCF57595.1 hypothetical protein KAFR_0C06040 [Kazachstania africana CBS 2517]
MSEEEANNVVKGGKEVSSEEPSKEKPEDDLVEDVDIEENDTNKSVQNEDESKEKAPPLPTREKTPETKEENPIFKQLREAFPNIEENHIKAVIIASQGAIDPAFNALLFLSDPDSGKDIKLPSRPVTPGISSHKKLNQLEQDEMLARQLSDQYNKPRRGRHHRPRPHRPQPGTDEYAWYEARIQDRERRRHRPLTDEERREIYDDDDTWANFVEKDLPELRAKANKSIQETATKVSNWWSGVTKNFANDEYDQQPRRSGSNTDYNMNDDQLRQQEEALRYYEKKRSNTKPGERRRFNSFGAHVGERGDSLENHGILLTNEDLSDDEDVPPQLPSRERSKNLETASSADPDSSMITNEDQKVIPQTTYIDTPDTVTKKKWQPVPPEPLGATPTKVTASTKAKLGTSPDADEFLINSDDE